MLSWFIAMMTLAGAALNIAKNRWGFAIWIFTNVYWAVHNYRIGEHQQTIIFVVFALLAVSGFFLWGKEIRSDKEK